MNINFNACSGSRDKFWGFKLHSQLDVLAKAATGKAFIAKMWYTLRIFLKHYQNYTRTFPNVFSFLNLCFKYVNQWTIPLNAKKDYRKRKKINSQKVSPASPLPNYALDVFLVEIQGQICIHVPPNIWSYSTVKEESFFAPSVLYC